MLRVRFQSTLLILAGIVLLQSVGHAGGAEPALPTSQRAAALVREALQAEVDGKPELRVEKLKQAIELAPDLAEARWQLGEVRRGDQWLSVDAAADEAAKSGRIDEYRRIRRDTPATPEAHLKLAGWCRRAGLPEQQRVHLGWALLLDPNCGPAMAKLGLKRVGGRLIPKDEIESRREQSRNLRLSHGDWQSRLRDLQGDLNNAAAASAALDELRTIRDPAAIPVLEKLFANSSAEVGLAIVEALSQMPQQDAVESLARHAVHAPKEPVRLAAAKALQSRDRYAYVPLLINALAPQVRVSFAPWQQGMARGSRLMMVREDALGDSVFVSSSSAAPDPSTVVSGRSGTWDSGQATARAAADARRAQNVAAQALQAAENANQLNERITTALRLATGKELGSDPLQWAFWWSDENGYYTPFRQPESIVESRHYTYRFVAFREPQQPRAVRTTTEVSQDEDVPRITGGSECFVAGTPVWTMTGPMPIEQLELGELVLSQNTETGELAYKAVIATTSRPPSKLVEIRVGDNVIRATQGHPFWVVGIGWQMAKELQAGQWLHTTRGPVLIDSAEPSYEAEAYNLVVADFNTYFVGKAQLLVHDNNLRGPNTASVPGLVNDE